MLSKISLTNFKCFESLSLSCTSLNVLCGLNGMGKSSVIQSLLVLRQSFQTGNLTNGRLVLGGARANIGKGLDVLFEGAERDKIGFVLESNETGEAWEMDFNCSSESDLLEVANSYLNVTTSGLVSNEWKDVPPFGGNLVHVSADRLGPQRFYPATDALARRREYGPRSQYVWNILNRFQHETLPEGDLRIDSSRIQGRSLIHVVDDWMQHICPGAHLKLEAIQDADAVLAGFTFDQPGDVASRKYRATNVGFGLSYVIPVILALLEPSGTLCMIENPEAHLHPQGQSKLAELTARAAEEGVQVIVETHSDHFMDGIRIAVREGIISHKETSFQFFERQGTKAMVTSPPIDEEGRLSHWPKGFFDQHELNLAKLLEPRKLNA